MIAWLTRFSVPEARTSPEEVAPQEVPEEGAARVRLAAATKHRDAVAEAAQRNASRAEDAKRELAAADELYATSRTDAAWQRRSLAAACLERAGVDAELLAKDLASADGLLAAARTDVDRAELARLVADRPRLITHEMRRVSERFAVAVREFEQNFAALVARASETDRRILALKASLGLKRDQADIQYAEQRENFAPFTAGALQHGGPGLFTNVRGFLAGLEAGISQEHRRSWYLCPGGGPVTLVWADEVLAEYDASRDGAA